MSKGFVRLIWVGFAAAALAAAQESIFTRATPDVDAALRARVTAYYEAQQQGKWRQAQTFVSDESIDTYLERDKDRYASFEIKEVRWKPDYKEAEVMMIVPYRVTMMPGTVISAPRPLVDHWRLEDGEWMWFVPKIDPCAPMPSPIGMITPACKDGKPINPADPQRDLETMVAANSVDLSALQNRVSVSAREIKLSAAAAGEQSVTVTNSFDGPVTLEVVGGKVPGLATVFDGGSLDTPERIEVQAKRTATLRFRFEPGSSNPPDRLGLQIRVEPLNVSLPVDVLFSK